jgi:translation initiation factor 3 subunit L
MADPSAFYEPEEEELLSSLSVPNYNGAGYDGDQEYQQHLQELESHAFAQNGQDQEAEQAAALEGVPKDVKRVRLVILRRELQATRDSSAESYSQLIFQFLVLFHQAILENDLPAITNMYESGWQKLTQVCLPRVSQEFEEELILATLPIK